MKVKVKLYGQDIGLLQDNNGIYFEYDKKFLVTGYSLSPFKLPLQKGIFTNSDDKFFMGLMGVFFDSLPDKFGNKIIEAYYKEKGIDISQMSILQKLVYIGDRSIGALEYEPIESDIKTNEAVALRELVDGARDVLKGNVVLPEIMEASASVGGARTKALIAIHNDTKQMITGDTLEENWTNYIIKFDTIEESFSKEYTKIEYIYMKIAKKIGIDVSDVEFLDDRDYLHLLVKRFDRVDGEKIHLHSLCGLTHIDFNQPQIFSYEEYLKTILYLTKDYAQLEEGFKRMIFNIVSKNQDDHLKNFSFLMDKNGFWSLSPAYDLTYAYGSGYTKYHQMTINAKYNNITKKDILKIANEFDIKNARKIIENIVTIFDEEFDKLATTLKLSEDKKKKILSNMNRLG